MAVAVMEGSGNSKRCYSWKPGSHISLDANEAGAVCEQLSKSGQLTAQALVDVSRPSDAPLHGYFEWNDVVAAEKWRVHQGGHIIRCIVVQLDDDQQPERKQVIVNSVKQDEGLVARHANEIGELSGSNRFTRAFVSTTLQGEPASPYERIETVIADKDKRKRLIELARRDLRIFDTKYRQILSMTGMDSAFDQLMLGLESYADE